MEPSNLLHSPHSENQSVVATDVVGTEVVATDLEGTLTAGIAFKGMLNYLRINDSKEGLRSFYYGRLPEYFFRRITGRGLRHFKNQWIRDLLYLYRGFTVDEFQQMATWAVQNELWPLRRKAVLDELDAHREKGRRIIIVTGLFEPYVAMLLTRLPGLEAFGTPVEIENGRLTGRLAAPFTVGHHKVEKLEPLMTGGKILAAYGDTGSDRFMLAASQHPVAVHPDKTLRRLARSEGWRILE